jgi:hypothetical protein
MFYQWVEIGYGQSIAVVLNRCAAVHFCIASFCQMNREALKKKMIIQYKICNLIPWN